MFRGFWLGLGVSFLVPWLAGCSTLPQPTPPLQGLHAQARRLVGEMSQIRDLEQQAEVVVGLKSRAGLRQVFRDLVEEEWTEHDDGIERAYKLFGLLPPEMHTKSYLIDLYSEQVAGYYDPKKAEFFIVEPSDASTDAARTAAIRSFTIAHEGVHALQDQHFDLEALLDRLEGHNDPQLAGSAVMEGDATLAAFDHLLWQRVGWPLTLASPVGRQIVALISRLGERIGMGDDSPEARQLREAPPVIRSELLFAYLKGLAFVSAIRAEFGWEGVNALFADLPESTEQILHPERYIDRRDRPVAITLADGPAGWSSVFSETLGMLTTQVLLREGLGRWAARAAEGWDGDRYVVWETPDGVALGWLTVWDRSYPARRFEWTYRRLLRRKPGVEDRFAVIRRGNVVAAVEGGRPGEAEAAAARLLQSAIERRADDQTPESVFGRGLRWPISVRRLARVFEIELLGGSLLRLRSHERGHQLSLLGGLLGRSEVNPDRRRQSMLLGLLWSSANRMHDYQAWSLALLVDYHRRDSGRARRYQISLLRVPFLGPLLSLRKDGDVTRAELLSGLALRLQWGPGTGPGEHARVLGIPVPGL